MDEDDIVATQETVNDQQVAGAFPRSTELDEDDEDDGEDLDKGHLDDERTDMRL